MSKSNEIGSLAARLTLADAILSAVRESGLLRKAKRGSSVRRKAALRRWRKVKRVKPSSKSGSTKASKLNKVPDTTEVA